jgi:hypothetical protein
VYVRPIEGEGKWQVSPDLGSYPRWSRDGKRLFYIDIGSPKRPLMVVNVNAGENTLSIGPHETVISGTAGVFATSTAPVVNWDVAPAGDRFVFVEVQRDEAAAARVEIALNWAQHLELESQ